MEKGIGKSMRKPLFLHLNKIKPILWHVYEKKMQHAVERQGLFACEKDRQM
jgi:hypothetical protein